MKTSILGKIVLLAFFIQFSFANVLANLSKDKFYLGDTLTLSIQASGENINFPQITSIEGYQVTGTSQSQQISIINGKRKLTQIMQYNFAPTSSLEIQPIYIEIDGKQFQTNSLKATMEEPSASKESDPISLIITTDKSSYYQGEPILAKMVFKYTQNAGVIDAKLLDFEPNNFWVKPLKNKQPYQHGGYITYELNYILFAKKSGSMEIPNQAIKVAKQSGMSFMRWDKVFSNKLPLEIKPLPQGIHLVGNYTIKASVDKTSANQNDAINLTIKVEGEGNIEDIPEFKLDMPQQVLYSSKPILKTDLADSKFIGEFSQKISIVSDNDYTINPIKLQYFDLSSQSIKTIATKPIPITINKTQTKTTPKIETLQDTTPTIQVQKELQYVKEDAYVKYLFGAIGFILGGLLSYLLLKNKSKKSDKKDTPLIKKIKKAKDDKALYDILTPYIQDKTIYPYIKLLEENIYNHKHNKIDKTSLIEYVKEDLGI
jgi:hypothetical protein